MWAELVVRGQRDEFQRELHLGRQGELIPVGLAHFAYDRAQPHGRPWRVTTSDGAVDLDFVPEGLHEEKINAFLVASNFKQVFGRFNGCLRTVDGREIAIVDQYGFVEDQYAKW